VLVPAPLSSVDSAKLNTPEVSCNSKVNDAPVSLRQVHRGTGLNRSAKATASV